MGWNVAKSKNPNWSFPVELMRNTIKKKFLQYQNIIEAHNILPLSKVADFLIGPFGSAYDTSLYVEQSNYRYIRGQDVKPFLLQDTSPR